MQDIEGIQAIVKDALINGMLSLAESMEKQLPQCKGLTAKLDEESDRLAEKAWKEIYLPALLQLDSFKEE